MESMSKALLIFAKAPEPGKTKTRMVPFLTESCAALLQEAMILDMLRLTAHCVADRFILAFPSAKHPFFQKIQAEIGLRCLDQQGNDLGERIEGAFHQTWKEGYEHVVTIGTDSPTLPLFILREAFRRLEDDGIVLGPSIDGGFYLIGLRKPIEGLFKGIAWGTDRVLTEILTIINRKGQICSLLPFWYDLDRPGDLLYLVQHLELLRRKKEAYPTEVFRLLQSLHLPSGEPISLEGHERHRTLH